MTPVRDILYVSCLCSEPTWRSLFETAAEKPSPAPQKFHSLLVRGFVENGVRVTALVARPVSVRTHSAWKRWRRSEETVDGVRYIYLPFWNQPFLKWLSFKTTAFFAARSWARKSGGAGAMVADILADAAAPARRACALRGLPTVGIVTDIPGLMVAQKTKSAIRRWGIRSDLRTARKMSQLVLMTEPMNEWVNPSRKAPYVIVEGMVDRAMESRMPAADPDGRRHITYTGALHARYGVRMLVEGFRRLPDPDAVLDLYGDGPMEEEIRAAAREDARIRFHGIVPIAEAVEAQRRSTLLVNPRPTGEEFTKYSFPSKNMEYMVSGVPLLTTALPGMPAEYRPFVFLLEEETAGGVARRLEEILSLPAEERQQRGLRAREFVLREKNQVRQAQRILAMIDTKER